MGLRPYLDPTRKRFLLANANSLSPQRSGRPDCWASSKLLQYIRGMMWGWLEIPGVSQVETGGKTLRKLKTECSINLCLTRQLWVRQFRVNSHLCNLRDTPLPLVFTAAILFECV